MRTPWLEPKRPAILGSCDVKLTLTNILLKGLASKHCCSEKEMQQALEFSLVELLSDYTYIAQDDYVLRSQTQSHINNGIRRLRRLPFPGRVRVD